MSAYAHPLGPPVTDQNVSEHAPKSHPIARKKTNQVVEELECILLLTDINRLTPQAETLPEALKPKADQ
jgi:hypothetical protein